MKNKIALLEISTWKGISIDAQHFYRKIYYNDKDGDLKTEEITKNITEKEAICLNKKHGRKFGYKKGDKTKCFDTPDEVKKNAINWFIKNLLSKNVKYLINGRYAILEPQEIIFGKGKIIEKNNELAKRRESLTWEDNENEMEKIINEWKPIAKKIGVW